MWIVDEENRLVNLDSGNMVAIEGEYEEENWQYIIRFYYGVEGALILYSGLTKEEAEKTLHYIQAGIERGSTMLDLGKGWGGEEE